MFYKKGVLQNFANLTFPRPATLLEKRLWHRCFPVKFEKFLRAPNLKNFYERLLLENYILTFLTFSSLKTCLFCNTNSILSQKMYYFYFFLGIPEFLDSGPKSWTLDSGRWTLDSGRWTLDAGLWTLITGR